jgi:hypothetical protein
MNVQDLHEKLVLLRFCHIQEPAITDLIVEFMLPSNILQRCQLWYRDYRQSPHRILRTTR